MAKEALSSYSLQKVGKGFFCYLKIRGVVNVQGSTLDIYEYEMIMQAIDQIYSCDDIPQLIQLIAITKRDRKDRQHKSIRTNEKRRSKQVNGGALVPTP